jgi:hypothetical protein
MVIPTNIFRHRDAQNSIPYTGITHSPYIQELVVRARQLDSVALERRNGMAGWIHARRPIVNFFAVAPG